ncbi:MAG: hypothetical protein IBX62_08875 [Coriobacteriia bacterium]|nr:hypothetical protein [Coriobacteriia bacterium]
MDRDPETYPDHRPLGFVANPFAGQDETEDPYWVQQLVHAEANRLLRVVDAAAGAPDARPVLLGFRDDIPDYYLRAALNEFLYATARDERLNVLAFNVGMDMMRLGRIRGTLTELAELLAAAGFDLTLAAYVSAALREPDGSLPEYAAVEELGSLEELAERFSSEPAEAVAEHFGGLEPVRKPDEEANVVLYETYLRSVGLEADPEEAADTDEESAASAAGQRPERRAEGEGEEGAGGEPAPRPVAEYVIAHLKAHLSPVVARAVRAYVSDGFAAVAQELKVTKAPKKTLAAAARFATFRWRKLVVVYDRFDPWPTLDDETKALVVGSLSELRWVLGPHAVFAISLPHGLAPQIEEQFAGAERVEWDFAGIEEMLAAPTVLDPGLVRHWLEAAALNDDAVAGAERDLSAIAEAAGGDLLKFGRAAHAAFDHAARRAAASLDAGAIEHGLSAADALGTG